jgi:hypothetical protein
MRKLIVTAMLLAFGGAWLGATPAQAAAKNSTAAAHAQCHHHHKHHKKA